MTRAIVAIVDPGQGRHDAHALGLMFDIVEDRRDTTLVEIAGDRDTLERLLDAWGFTADDAVELTEG